MSKHLIFATLGCAAIIFPASAQNLDRRADMVGGGGPDSGKCTIEVTVDGAVEIQVRGTNATMRNLNGQSPQWRRFQCTGPMPANPVNFRFAGVDGRGRQQLVSEPRNGGPAIIRIEDSDNGAEGYTFDLTWGNAGGFLGQGGPGYNQPGPGYNQPPQPPFDRGGRPDDRYDRSDRGYGDRPGPRFTTEQAIRVCQDSVRAQASSRFGGAPVTFRDTNIDNNPGRNDWVIGSIAVRTSRFRSQIYRFSCSVDFSSGRVRTANIGVPNY